MPICQRVLSVSTGKSSVVDVSAESPPAHASRAYLVRLGLGLALRLGLRLRLRSRLTLGVRVL